MKKYKNLLLLITTALLLLLPSCNNNKHSFVSFANDPLNTRIYTLDNGLKVYMTVNKETPRIQTYIAVRVGGKNDPAETTGLAHYFEHLMFKGTKQFGTQNYEQEEPLLDRIEELFEIYRKTTDEDERAAIYHQIDSISYEASKFSIPNEYDKLMATIGAEGTNAYTGYDMTVYVENIPSNQIDNWAKIQADRFTNNVIRGFHTELETVYEEKNMSLTNDGRKVYEMILSSLFPNHPYGKQTVLGTQKDLKNPSITNIKNYYKTYYVPNNMAICLSGDFNPDEMIEVIDKYFGGMQPNNELPKLQFEQEEEIKEPILREVYGKEAEMIALAWRFPGKADPKNDILNILSNVLYNGSTGLIDLNINQTQKALGAYSGLIDMSDYSTFLMMGNPKSGQTLDELKDLLINEVEKVKKGAFEERLLTAIINNYKADQMKRLENNRSRANLYVESFINGTKWEDEIGQLERLSKITKEDLVTFANQYLKDNYVYIKKIQGEDKNENKISKPQITPIIMNRDAKSEFLKEIQATQVKPIEPVFIDFDKDMEKFTIKSGIEVLYKQNLINDLFTLIYHYDMGRKHIKALPTAIDYLQYLGTSEYAPEELKMKFYEMACDYTMWSGLEQTDISLRGLNQNLPEAIKLGESLLADAQVNKEIYTNLVGNELKARDDQKHNQRANFNALMNYGIWGENSPAKNILSQEELLNMDPQKLIDIIKNQRGYKHRILYYGPMSKSDLEKLLNEEHLVPEELSPIPAEEKSFSYRQTEKNEVLLAPYKAEQIYMSTISNKNEIFDPNIEPLRNMYNEYFGGGMNSIVFQEMRESRALAYSAGATMMGVNKKEDPYIYRTFIATQNDKMINAIEAFNQIINEMPLSETAFNLAKESIIARLRTERITKMNVLWEYLNNEKLGLTEDSRKTLFETIPNMTLENIKAYQEKWVKDRPYTYCILGDEKQLDMKEVSKIGPIKRLTTEEIFGY